MYTKKCLNEKVAQQGCIEQIEMYRKCEYYNAKKNGKVKLHYKKWHNIMCNNTNHVEFGVELISLDLLPGQLPH